MKTLTIGNVELANRYILAPMAGVTDLPFRLLCREMGAGLLCMEMVSAKAVLYGNKNTESLLKIHPDEPPVSLQLFGSDPDIMSEIAKRMEERPFTFLDINMGCPVPKIVKNSEGSALTQNPRLVHEIVSKVAGAIQKPVTVKIRKVLMMTMSMRWRSRRSSRTPGALQWLCTAGRGNSITPERLTGILSVR